MAADILVTPENLIIEAKNLLANKSELDSIFAEIKNLIAGLVSHWHGETQQAFQNSFNQKEPVFKKFAQDMESFSQFMNKYAYEMQNLETDNKNMAIKLGS